MEMNLNLQKELNLLKNSKLYNHPVVLDSPVGAYVKINGKKYLNFSSNDYLGLANDQRLKKKAILAIKKYGISPAAVRTIAGTTTLHKKLEEKIAEFKKTDLAILFQSGFAANISVIPPVSFEGEIFSDELNHASIIDGCKLSKAQTVRYSHSDMEDLEIRIRNSKVKNKVIVTDGVFSMDGDLAKLPQIVKIAKKYNCLVVVDDAHGEGVLGKNGRGIVDHFGLHGQVDIEIGTMSKAFGVVGGYAAGKKEIIELLSQKARPYLFSSSMTFPDVAACLESINIVSKSNKLIKKLWNNSHFLKANLRKLGFDIGASVTPITPIMLFSEETAQTFAEELFKRKSLCQTNYISDRSQE
jgi:glycine C-acetyltransferase